MLLRLLLVSCSFSIITLFCPTSYASPPAILSKSDRSLLKQPINNTIKFPEDLGNPLKNKAAKFLNITLKTHPTNYQVLLRQLIDYDKKLSHDPAQGTPPGSFLNTVADLYATIKIDVPLSPITSSSDQTSAKIVQEKQLLKFANILQKEAKILNRAPKRTQDRLTAFEATLDQAKINGTLPPKIYVYSDSPTERIQYEAVVERYYPGHEILIYNVVPSAYDPLYINRLAETTAAIGDGLIFF